MRTFQATTTPSRFPRGLGCFLLVAALWCVGEVAWAQEPVATVRHVAGLSTARRDDGGPRILAPRSVIHEGETLATEADTYLEVRFVDDATLVLGPASRVRVTRYSWNSEHPEHDRVVLELLGGSLRSETGRLGKRNHEAIVVKVPGGEIAVHGTNFVVLAPPASGSGQGASLPMPSPTGLNPGLYVQVLDGMINVSNAGGSTNFSAGQFGFTPSFQQPPVILPTNPGLQFTPPPSFSATPGPTGGATPSKSDSVDCQVR